MTGSATPRRADVARRGMTNTLAPPCASAPADLSRWSGSCTHIATPRKVKINSAGPAPGAGLCKGARRRRAMRALSGQGRSNTAWDQLLSRSAPGSADITRFAGCRNWPKAAFRAEVDGRPCQPSAGIREMTGADPSGNPQVSLRFGAESRFLGPPEAPVTRRCRAISTSRPAADPRTRPYLTPRPDQPTRRPHPTAERAQYIMLGCSALAPRPFCPLPAP